MSEASKERYRLMREQGICFDCRKPLDRDGIVCTACNEKRNAYQKEYRELYISRGICPRCRKNKLYGDEKNCLDCKAKHSTKMNVARNTNREKYNARTRAYQKKKTLECVEKGICTKCHKRKADAGFKRCSICREKNTDYNRTRHYKERDESVCKFCNEPVEKGYKVCKNHRLMFTNIARGENAVKARQKMKKRYSKVV